MFFRFLVFIGYIVFGIVCVFVLWIKYYFKIFEDKLLLIYF